MPALLISPHLDDAVFSCGEWLQSHPGTRVLTVFAGLPPDPGQRTDWDAQCGFSSAGEAVRARREEDRAALALLGCEPCWLSFGDSQYGATPTVDAVARALEAELERHAAQDPLLFPMGLFHSDHRLVHEACMAAWRRRPRPALMYEDALYRGIPGLLQERLAELLRQGCTLTPDKEMTPRAEALKARAVQCYASQLRAFGPGGHDDTARPERRWRFDARPDAASAPQQEDDR
ncbi:PIG-L family deacetylase [Azohydromonas caseinilytica]|uniref:PIG-L family deacetylase n=1 Tax=Azohydromonas caseinilytica TaxID=2728836 RepID=A0A848F563_9BURK|nr:PIG-L family deacetylase [Azohydromonas caseinilytica]NML14248.1 PIG-L family deacetylase [Azohydromonas caseinilytica]